MTSRNRNWFPIFQNDVPYFHSSFLVQEYHFYIVPDICLEVSYNLVLKLNILYRKVSFATGFSQPLVYSTKKIIALWDIFVIIECLQLIFIIYFDLFISICSHLIYEKIEAFCFNLFLSYHLIIIDI